MNVCKRVLDIGVRAVKKNKVLPNSNVRSQIIPLFKHTQIARMASLQPADRVRGMQDSVWIEFVQLALEHKPVNLGQGFPDFAAPDHVTKALSEATLSTNVLLNQYTRGPGHPRLVNAIAKLYSKLLGKELNAQKEVLITVGAYEALFSTIMGFINPSDEVIIIEPFFDCYEPMVILAGGVPVFIPFRLKSGEYAQSTADWHLDPAELASKFTSKTKMIIVNTPHNPLGKVFQREELRMIADLCIKHNVLCVMDEVYEWIVYPGSEHVRMASFPDMWDRTITIGSAGKTFSVTGWKLGWAYGPQHLIRGLTLMHQNCIYTCPTPIQEAVASSFEIEIERLGKPDSYWKELSDMLLPKRDKMAKFLLAAGIVPIIPEGGYFLTADFSKLGNRIDTSKETGTNDYRFSKWLTKNKKLQGIPSSAFYGDKDKHLAQNMIRFCFIKDEETLNKAEAIVNDLKKTVSML